MRLHHEFEWDAAKARTNQRKHGVPFVVAAKVLADPDGSRMHIEEFDDPHSEDEDRWITTASHPDERSLILRIAWTRRGGVTRVISARLATPMERRDYESQIYS